jgi:CRISPR/Cas system-associated exonuclease Cas4 (RecB family)
MNITHISVSRKQVWDTCQEQYKFKYHLHTPVTVEEPYYFTYGSFIHKVAEEYVRGRGQRQINEIANDVISGAIPLDKPMPPLPPEYKKKVASHLRAITSLTDKTGYDGELEYEFKYDLNPPHESFVNGYIDRLIQKGDKFWIIDYKTTKKGWWRKGKDKIGDDLQLRMYARVVQKNFHAKAENIRAALYYLEGAELVGCCFSQESLERAEKELLECYHEIKDTPPEKAHGRVGDHCGRCDYRKECRFYRLTD